MQGKGFVLSPFFIGRLYLKRLRLVVSSVYPSNAKMVVAFKIRLNFVYSEIMSTAQYIETSGEL